MTRVVRLLSMSLWPEGELIKNQILSQSDVSTSSWLVVDFTGFFFSSSLKSRGGSGVYQRCDNPSIYID